MNDWAAFLAKEPVDAGRYYGMSHRERLRAFTVTCEASVAQLAQVRDGLVDVYIRGGTFADFRREVREGSLRFIASLPDHRLQNIFRTNVMGAYGRGRYLEQQEAAAVFPYLVYDAINDPATRPKHRALDGLIVKFGSPEADRIYPPNGFQCRCSMRGLTRRQAETRGIPSDEAVRALIAANPPDKGFDGPPFEGPPPSDVNDPEPPKPTSLSDRLKEAGVEIVSDEQYLAELEAAQTDIKAAGRVAAQVPESVVAGALKAEEDGQRFIKRLYGPEKTPMTDAEWVERRKVQKEILERFKDSGKIGADAGPEELDDYLMKFLPRLYADIGLDFNDCWKKAMRPEAILKIRDLLEEGSLLGYSAEVLKNLTLPQRMAFVQHTLSGDWYQRDLLLNPEDHTKAAHARNDKCHEAQNILLDALNESVKLREMELSRGTKSYKDGTGQVELSDFLAEGAEGKNIKLSLTLSFTSSRSVANDYAEVKGTKDKVKLIFKVRTGKALPIDAAALTGPGNYESIIPADAIFSVGKVVWSDDRSEAVVELGEPTGDPEFNFALCSSS